jgi:hypothetical protein
MDTDLPAIRAGLRTVLAGADGIKSASAYPTENIGAVPFAFVGFDDDTVATDSRETHLHRLPITVLVDRKAGNLVNQVKATEAALPNVLAAIRADQDLGKPNEIARVEIRRIRQGIYKHAEIDYVGFIVDVEILESFPVYLE